MHTHPLDSKTVKHLFIHAIFAGPPTRRVKFGIPWDEIPCVTSRAGKRANADSLAHFQVAAQLTKRAPASIRIKNLAGQPPANVGSHLTIKLAALVQKCLEEICVFRCSSLP